MMAFSSSVMRVKAGMPSLCRGGANLHHAGAAQDVFEGIAAGEHAAGAEI